MKKLKLLLMAAALFFLGGGMFSECAEGCDVTVHH